MAKKKYTPEATVDLLYNRLMDDYKGDAQAEAERQRQRSAEGKKNQYTYTNAKSTNSSTGTGNTLQSSSTLSRGASAVGNIYKAPKRKYTTGGTVHGSYKGRSFAKDQTTKPKTSGTRGIGSATQEAFERGLSSRSLKENVGQRSSLNNKESRIKESDLNDFSRNRSHNQAKILDKKQAYVQAQRYENDLKKQRAEYDRLREEHPTSEWLKEEGWGALTGFNSTLASTADWLLPDVITPKAVQNALDYYKKEDEKQQKIVEEVRGGDPLRTIGGNLGVNIIQNIPAMLLAPLATGETVVTTAGTLLNPETLSQTGNAITRALYSVARETGNNPMFWETFLRTAGPTYDKEIESGADPVRATLSALTNGLLNAQIEVGGGIEKFDPTETFWKALRRSGEEEGLEEVQQYAVEGLTNKALGSNTAKWFSTKRGEDAVINPIDMAEQGAYGALAGGLMGGGRAGVATLSRSMADAEYNRAFPDSKAHTQDLVEQALMQAREGQKSSEAEILATNIQNMMEQGEEVPTVLVRQLHNEVLRAQAENERDFSERKNEGYQQAVSEGRANTVETQDTEEESRVFRSVADEKAQTYYDTAMDKMGENASERSARAISKLMVGVHTNQDIDTILIDKNARNAVEEMTGIDLPIKNSEAREILETRGLTNMVANRDNMLQETHNVIRSNMRGREGAVFEKNYDNAVKTIGVANAPEIYESVFSRFKNAGMVKGSDFDSAYDRIVSPLTKDFGEELGGRIALVFNRDFAHQAFDAGRQAYIADEAKTSAREKAVSAERAGTVTYKHDTESRLSTRQKKFMTEFAKRAKLGIEFYDGTQEGEDDSANGYYENGVIHININSTNKLITVAKHELTHHIKVTAPEMYRKLEDFVIKKWYNNDPDAFDERVLEYQRKWNCSVEVAYEEIIANASEAFFTDKGTIDDAIKFSKKLGHTIHDGIRTLLDTFLDIQDTDRLGDRGYGEFLKELNILKDAQRMWLEALNESVERGKKTNGTAQEQQLDNFLKEHNLERIDEPKRSLKVREDNRGGTISDSQFDFFKNSQAVDDKGHLQVVYHTTADGGFTVFDPAKGDDKISIFFSDSLPVSQTYAENSEKPISFGHMPADYDRYLRRAYGNDYVEKAKIEVLDEDGNIATDLGKTPTERYKNLMSYITDIYESKIPNAWTKDIYRVKSDLSLLDRKLSGEYTTRGMFFFTNVGMYTADQMREGYYECYLNLKNPLIVDAQGEQWYDIPYDYSDENWLEQLEEASDVRISKISYDPPVYEGDNFGTFYIEYDVKGSKGKWKHREKLVTAKGETRQNLDEAIDDFWQDSKDLREINFWDDIYTFYLKGKSPLEDAINTKTGYIYFDEFGQELSETQYSKRGDTRDIAKLAKDSGYDGVIIRNVVDLDVKTPLPKGVSPQSTVYIAFSSNQVKDIYNETPTKNEDIRFSKKDDQDYLDAVNRGDMKTAQRMVEQEARSKGYNSPLLYSGTDHFGFTKIDAYANGGDGSFWASNREDTSGTYTVLNRSRRISSQMSEEEEERYRDELYEETENRIEDAIDEFRSLIDRTFSEWYFGRQGNSIIRDAVMNANPKMGYGDGVYDALDEMVVDAYYQYQDDFANDYEDLIDWQENSPEAGEIYDVIVDIESLRSTLENIEHGDIRGGIYQLYANTNNMYELDAKGSLWNNLRPEGLPKLDRYGIKDVPYKTRDVVEWAKNNGYEGVIFRNIKDNGKYGRTGASDVYAFLNPDAQVKSADPVTYDDNGNVIPLSERFNKQNEDIRYSHKDSDGRTLTEAQVDYFKDSKVRDKDGNLLVMYHGSPNRFTIFDIGKARPGYYGRGFYFTDSRSRATQYGNPYTVYLDVKNPLTVGSKEITRSQLKKYIQAIADNEDYGLENYGYGATVDSVLKDVWGRDDFSMLQDLNATAVGDFAEAVKLFNDVNGTDYDGIVTDTETVVFRPEQIKETENKNPSKDADIRFSKKADVEETQTMIAWHNINSGNINGVLELGGLAMPSFALRPSNMGFSGYGDISIIADKRSIDPKAGKSQMIFGGDAWTPMFPPVDIKIDSKVAENLRKRFYGILGFKSSDELRKAFAGLELPALDVDNLADQIQRWGDPYSAYGRNDALRLAYVMNGMGVQMVIPMKQGDLRGYDKKFWELVDERIPEDVDLYDGNSMQYEPALREAMYEAYGREFDERLANLGKLHLPNPYKKELSFAEVDNILYALRAYRENGIPDVVDIQALEKALGEKINEEDYRLWIDDLFEGIVEKRGIRNDKDLFTPSGSRRGFDALHYEYNLENIVKAMKSQSKQGNTSWLANGSNVKGASLKSYNDIEYVRNDLGRIVSEKTEEVKALYDQFDEQVKTLANKVAKGDPFTGSEILADVLSHAKTEASIFSYLNREYSYLRTQDHLELKPLATDIYEIGQLANTLPMEYFEAKVYREFPLQEALAIVVPDTLDSKIVSRIKEHNVNVLTYEAGNDEDRLAKVNSIEGARFSKKDSDGNTLTEAQAEYFKDSKARDEDGNLLVTYHGSPFEEEFNVFDSRNGSGLKKRGWNWFTPDAKYAEGYSIQYSRPGHTKTGYVNATNPLDIGDINKRGVTSNPYGLRFSNAFKRIAKAVNTTPEELYRLVNEDYGGDEDYDALDNLYDDWSSDNVKIPLFAFTKSGAFRELAEKAGYDSVKALEDGAVTYGVADSNQFKNIDNENPTDNPDIRLSRKTENEALPKARTIPKKIKDRLIALGADKLGKGGLKAPVQISVRDLRTLWYELKGSEEGERLNTVLEVIGDELQELAGKYRYVSLADALEGTIHYRVDENGKPTSIVLSCKVKNAEYDINFDFTTICAKRAPLQKVLERFIKTEGKNKGETLYDELKLDEEGLYTLRSIMEQEGFDVSCIGCFVEQNRYAQQTQSKTVADDWNKALDEWAKEHGVEITEGFDFQNLDIDQLPYSEIQKGFRQYSALMKGKPTTVENKNKALIEAIPYLRKRLGNSDYASIAGQRAMMAMGNGKTNLYNLLKRGQGDSKQSTPFVPYNGEVALLPETKKGKKIFDYLFGIGGARAQSASDFQIEYVFDYMQLVGDLSARGLPMHMYTKVIECAELLGMCGIKINLSAMCDVDSSVDGEYAGLKKVNGKWVYNISKQSIDYERAVKLQRKEGYRKNIGIIMVVLSKQHMLKALSDADVRYIIGYHSSKMPPIVARASKMEGATDYTKLNKTNRLNDKGRALFAEAMSQAKGKTELEKYKDALRIFDDLIQTDKLKTRGEVPRRGNEYTRYMSSFKANTADFDVYDDIKKTNDPRTTADNYIRYCMENDLVPMYFPFAFHENYYKCEVYDYNVYDNETGEYAPMEAVQNIYPELNIANGETDTKRFMAKVRKMVKRQNKKNAKVEPKYEAVERRAIAELSITGNDYMDMDASGIDHAELEHRVDMTEEAVEERRRSIKEKELNAKTIEYQSTIRKLEKNVEGLKAQFKRTNKKPNPVEARRQAGRLIQRHASNMRIHEDVANTLTEIYEMYAKRGAKAFDDIYAIAERTAVEIVNNISEVHFEGQEEYKQIKDYLRDTDIVVSEEMKRNITDFNDFRKSHFGKLKLVNGERSNIDSVYEELSEMFPSQFTDEYVNPADQLNHIADVLDSYAPFYETLDGTSEEMQDYVVTIASDLMETAYNLQKSKTFADKKYDEKVKAVKKAREKALANKKEALSKLRARYSSRMAEAVRDAKSETKAKIDEKAQKKRHIAQIAKTHKRLADKLFAPSDTKHLPDGYDKAVANVLHMFDFTTSRMEKWAETHDEPSKRMQALRDLRKRLESYVRASEDGNKEGVDLGMEVDSDLVGIVDELEGALGENVKLSDLDSTVLEDVATLFRAFEHQINSYNRAFDENNQKRISDLADVVVDEAKAVKHGKWRAGIMGRVFTSNLNPWDFFQMIGGEVGDLYKATRKGFDKYENNLRVAKRFMADLIGSKQYDKWANHTKTYKTTSGEEITLTDTQLMSLYCLSKRDQAQGHIYGQGVVSAPVKVKRNMIAKQLDKKRVIPTFDDVVDWTKNLSKEQIEVADKIQNFLSNEVSEWGNETSLKLYGYKKFTEKDYFPIQSSDDYLNSNFDAKGSDPTLKNISPTKAVVKGANNPLMLDDIFSIFSKHVAQMASYNGFVPAITDFQRVWNHKMVSADGRKTTVKETFGEAYGDRIAKYVEQFYADLNGVYKKNLDVTTPEKLFGTFKKSAVGGNLRVLAQQPMAIARAMLLIDPTLLTVSVPKTALQAKRTYQEMIEHCPIAEWKVWGFYSPDVMGASRDLKNIMLGKDSISDKVFMNMYGVADNITWTVIFNACKMQVERQNKGIVKGSQEYWDKVNDLASDVYDATQVVDSPFHRSELMKSQDGIHKMATAFMAEPTKTVNMLNTQLTLCAREISEGKVGKATLRFTRLTGTVLANAMLLAVGQSLIDAMRSAGGGDDDDDKGDFEERFKKHWVTNTKDNLNLLKMLPYVKDAVSIYEGFGVTRMDMNGVEKAVKATQALKKYYDDPESAKYTELELWNNTAMAFAYTLGVPISNAKRDLDSLALTVAESVKDPKVMLWYMRNKYQVNSKTKSIWADAYYDALDKGNTGLAKNIYAYMKKSGVDDKYIQNRKKTWEKHRYGEEEEE